MSEMRDRLARAMYRRTHEEPWERCDQVVQEIYLGDAEAALIELRQASAWQPIETAPEDELVLIWFVGFDRPRIARRRADGMWQDRGGFYNTRRVRATHWMPLPNRPPEPPAE